MPRYTSAEKMTKDDFGNKFTKAEGEAVYDAKTRMGPWATMTQAAFDMYGVGLGTGKGQKYVRNAENHLLKVEG